MYACTHARMHAMQAGSDLKCIHIYVCMYTLYIQAQVFNSTYQLVCPSNTRDPLSSSSMASDLPPPPLSLMCMPGRRADLLIKTFCMACGLVPYDSCGVAMALLEAGIR
jgi:hypothetical protein